MEQVSQQNKEDMRKNSSGDKFWTRLEILQSDSKSPDVNTSSSITVVSDDNNGKDMTLKDFQLQQQTSMVGDIDGVSGQHLQRDVCQLDESVLQSLSPSTAGSRSPPPYSGYDSGFQADNSYYDSKFIPNSVIVPPSSSNMFTPPHQMHVSTKYIFIYKYNNKSEDYNSF